jgi:hypothetical protein
MKHRVSNDNEDLELNQTVLVDLHVCAILTQFERQQKYMLNPSEKKKEEIRLRSEHIIRCEDALTVHSKRRIQRFKDLTRYDEWMLILFAHDGEDPDDEQNTLLDLHILAISMQIERKQKYMLHPSEEQKEEIRIHNEHLYQSEGALDLSSKACIQKYKDSRRYLISNTERMNDNEIKKQHDIELKQQQQQRMNENEIKKQHEIETKQQQQQRMNDNEIKKQHEIETKQQQQQRMNENEIKKQHEIELKQQQQQRMNENEGKI